MIAVPQKEVILVGPILFGKLIKDRLDVSVENNGREKLSGRPFASFLVGEEIIHRYFTEVDRLFVLEI